MLRTKEQWEAIYQEQRTPWDTQQADLYLMDLLDRGVIRSGKAVDLGCGPGNESILLAKRGFTVTGIDISTPAIAEARTRAQAAGVSVTLKAANVLDLAESDQYDFALDRACFHFLDPHEHTHYIRNVASILKSGGLFLLIVSSDKETPKGTYQFSKEQLKQLFSPSFEVVNIELVDVPTHKEKPTAYYALFRKRNAPTS